MMKSIRKGGISMLLLLGLAGCGKEIPSDIIQPSEMESLLYDYHLATTMGNDLPYGGDLQERSLSGLCFRQAPCD